MMFRSVAKRLLPVFLSLPICGFAAEVPIRLNPPPTASEVETLTTKNVTGSCGGSIVRVMGMSNEFVTSSFDYDAGRIIIRAGAGREMQLDFDDVLGDYNAISCMKARTGGEVLVISSACSGTACGEAIYFVVDPKALTFLAPKQGGKNVCDAKCAKKLVVGKLP